MPRPHFIGGGHDSQGASLLFRYFGSAGIFQFFVFIQLFGLSLTGTEGQTPFAMGPLQLTCTSLPVMPGGQPGTAPETTADRSGDEGVVGLLAYDVCEPLTEEDYDKWLFDVHYHDLLANPFLQKIVLRS